MVQKVQYQYDGSEARQWVGCLVEILPFGRRGTAGTLYSKMRTVATVDVKNGERILLSVMALKSLLAMAANFGGGQTVNDGQRR